MKYLIMINDEEFGIADDDGTYVPLEDAPMGSSEVQQLLQAGKVTPCKIENGKCTILNGSYEFIVGTSRLYPNQYDQDYVISSVTSRGADFISRSFGDYKFKVNSVDDFNKIKDELQKNNPDWKFVGDKPKPEEAVAPKEEELHEDVIEPEEAVDDEDDDALDMEVPDLDIHGIIDAIDESESEPLLNMDAAMAKVSDDMQAEEEEAATVIDEEQEEESVEDIGDEEISEDVPVEEDTETQEEELDAEISEDEPAGEVEVVEPVVEEEDPNRFVPPFPRGIPQKVTLEKQMSAITSMIIPEECKGESYAFTDDYIKASDVSRDVQCIEDNWEKRGSYWIIDVIPTGHRLIHSDKNSYNHEVPTSDCL